MSDVFISHGHDDRQVAIQIADGLERFGFTAWYYERDIVPGPPHLDQTNEAIEECQAVVLIISRESMVSNEVDSEVEWSHRNRKHVIPVLVDIAWDEFERRQRRWLRIVGSAVGTNVTPESIPDIVPKLVQGLKRLNVAPGGRSSSPLESSVPSILSPEVRRTIMDEYPFPLATTYAKVVARAELAQAVQLYEDLHDVAATIVKVLAVIATSRYRQDAATHRHGARAVEERLQDLPRAGLEGWLSLLSAASSYILEPSDELTRDIYHLLFEIKHQDNPVGEAAVKMQDWLDLKPPRMPPFTYGDFFEVLVVRREMSASPDARPASQQDYLERVRVLRPAIERTLLDLGFVSSYRLLHVQPEVDPTDHPNVYEAVGRNPALLTEPLSPAEALRPGHLYFCRREPAELDSLLDLYPLLICRECPACGGFMLFFFSRTGDERLEYMSNTCGHQLELDKSSLLGKDLARYVVLERWLEETPLPGRSDWLPYVNALREVMDNGDIGHDERQKLDFLAGALQIPRDVAGQLEDRVRGELEKCRRLAAWYDEAEKILERDPQRSLTLLRQIEQEDAAYPDLSSLRERAREMHRTWQLQQLARQAADVERLLVTDPKQALAAIEKIAEQNSAYPGLAALRDRAQRAVLETRLKRHTDASVGGDRAPGLAVPKPVLLWRAPVSAPVALVALSGSPASAFVADEVGNVFVYTDGGRLAYHDRLGGRPLRVTTVSDRVFIGSWDGYLYCLGCQELLWQVALRSPVSALAAGSGPLEIGAGTWDGRIVALGSDGEAVWQNRLDDGISALCVQRGSKAVVAASYAGHLGVLSADGEKVWLRDLQVGITRLASVSADDVVLATRDGVIRRLHLDNQAVEWQQAIGQRVTDLALSLNSRRLVVASTEGTVVIYNVNGGISRHSEHAVPELTQALLLPVSSMGNFAVCVSRRDGLVILDNRTGVMIHEPVQAARCVATSSDGRYILVGGARDVSLYRLPGPALQASLVPVGAVQRGRFTRLQVTLLNTGDLAARDISMEVDGAIDCSQFSLPRELAAGEEYSSDDQSIRPTLDGTLPLRVRLRYIDDLGIRHHTEEVELLDVAPGG